MFIVEGLGGLVMGLVFLLGPLLVLYWVIRLAVRHGTDDSSRRRD